MRRHRREHAFALLHAATERNHQLDVDQAHLLPHALLCRAFERKAFGVGWM